MMKGRQYNRRIFTSDVVPNVYVTEDSAKITDADIEFVANGNAAMEKDMKSLRDDLRYADEFGSLIDVKPVDFDAIFARLDEIEHAEYSDLVSMSEQLRCPDIIVPFVKQAQTMAQKYDVVCTNPPYMGGSGMNAKLGDFVKNNYADYKSDLFSAFIVRCTKCAKSSGFLGFMSPYVWMFIQSYGKLRNYIYSSKTIETLIQFEYSAFEEAVVPICPFILYNSRIRKKRLLF